ncbi:MAG: DUF4435 domain-containing protein [Chitinophagales bacterium]
MPRKNYLTADILISRYNKSHSKGLTILVEGPDDVKIYRLLEKSLGNNISVFPCGGRNTLLEIFERRAEFKNPNVIFIADSDMYVFSEIPAKYISDDLQFTKGYSIENDLYMDGQKMLDSAVLNHTELEKKQAILTSLIKWFAFQVEYHNNTGAFSCKVKEVNLNSTKYMLKNKTNFVATFLTNQNYKAASTAILEDLKANYAIKLRGKFLFQIYQKIFLEQIDKDRVKYSEMQLFSLCFNTATSEKQKNTNINRFLQWAEKRLINS